MAFSLSLARAGLRRGVALGSGGGFYRSARSARPVAVGLGAGLGPSARPVVVGLGAGLGPSATPVVGSGPAIFGTTRFRQSFRMSDAPFQKVEDHFDGWTAEDLVRARSIIDSKLAEKGLTIISTSNEAQLETIVRALSKQIPVLQKDVSEMKNKKGDITSIKIGKLGTLNVLSVLTLLLKMEEVWPMIPTIEAWIKAVMGG